MHEVKVLARSVGPGTPELTTVELYYPRMVHAELMTHRVLSRNAGSSRAIPTDRLVERSLDEMHVPRFRRNKPGMQPGEYLSDEEQAVAERIWRDMATYCAVRVRQLAEMGVHKQWANRPLEWFGHIRVVATATDWKNFFALREDVDEHMNPIAQDEIFYLARDLKEAMGRVEPTRLEPGQWHLPYVTGHDVPWSRIDWENVDQVTDLIKSSVARCARTSYDNVDGTPPEMSRDMALYEKLVGSAPLHASPAEHQATPDVRIKQGEFEDDFYGTRWYNWRLSGNLSHGWIQYRKLLANEWVPG